MQIKARALWMLERLSSDNTLTEDVQCSLIYGLVLFFYTEGFFFFLLWFLWHPSVQASGTCSHHFEVVALAL